MLQNNGPSGSIENARTSLEARFIAVEGNFNANMNAAQQLYNESELSTRHAEGPEIVAALLQQLRWQRDDGFKSLDDRRMLDRLEKVIALAESIFDQSQDIHSVIYFGSGLRGVPRPSDHDFIIVPDTFLPPNPEELTERIRPVMESMPIDRARIDFSVAADPDDADLVKTGPYLLIARGNRDARGASVHRAFYNPEGEEWKEPR